MNRDRFAAHDEIMENAGDIIQGNKPFDGIAPKFSKAEMTRMNSLSSPGGYWLTAYNFAHAYNRGSEHWEAMSRRQREWIWKIKDDIEDKIKRDRESSKYSE